MIAVGDGIDAARYDLEQRLRCAPKDRRAQPFSKASPMRMDKLTSDSSRRWPTRSPWPSAATTRSSSRRTSCSRCCSRRAAPCGRCSCKAGVNVNKLRSDLDARARPTAEGRGHAGRSARLERPQPPAQRHRQARAAARRPVHLQRAVRARGASRTAARWRKLLKDAGAVEGAIEKAIERGARRREGARPERRGEAPGAREIHHRSHRARRERQARSGDRPRRRDPPHDPGAAAAHQEQSRC